VTLAIALFVAMLVMVGFVIRDLFRGLTRFGTLKFTRVDTPRVYWSVLIFDILSICFMFVVAVQLAGETIGCDVLGGRQCTMTIRVDK
jgi:hypothetical protein